LIEGFVVVLVLLLVVYLPIGIVRGIKENQAEERRRRARNQIANRKRQSKRDKKEDYDFLLNELENHPNNPKIRRRCLEIGREYARMCREDGSETTFDELAIKNDIDAACAAASVTSVAAEDYELILPSEIKKANEPPSKRIERPKKRKTSKVAWGCLLLLMMPCFIGLLGNMFGTNEPQKNRANTRKPVQTNRNRSSTSDKPKLAAESNVATTTTVETKSDRQSNENSDETKSTQTQPVQTPVLTPQQTIAKLKALGFVESVSWRKSKWEAGWVGVLHKAVGKNEVSVELSGKERRSFDNATVEAEIYDLDELAQTTDQATSVLRLMSASEKIAEAMKKATKTSGRVSDGVWAVEVKKHNSGSGFDVRSKGTPSKHKPATKSKAKQPESTDPAT